MSDEKTLAEPRRMVDNPFGVEGGPIASSTGLVSVEQQKAIAEVQARMIIARANPRDPIRAMDKIIQECTRPTLAAGALYAYARGGTEISGPTIRLAETMARCWGNIASGIKEVSRTAGYSECVAYAWDLETGFYDERQFQIRHWRDTTRGGYQLTDERDIYELVANMGQRRKRAVLLTVIPGDVTEAATQQCEATLSASVDVTAEGVKQMADAFQREFGVTQAQLETRCQRHLASIRPAQMVLLRKIYASLREGMSVPTDWFEAEADENAATAPATAPRRGRPPRAAAAAAPAAAQESSSPATAAPPANDDVGQQDTEPKSSPAAASPKAAAEEGFPLFTE